MGKVKNNNIRKVFKVHKNSDALRVTLPGDICAFMGLKKEDSVYISHELGTNKIIIKTIKEAKKDGDI